MTQTTTPIERKRRRTARSATGNPSRGSAPAPRIRRTKLPQQGGAFTRPTSAIVAARTDLQNWLAGSMLRRGDSLMVASKLLAVAVEEARVFLDLTPLTMALAAIGTVPETVTGEELVARVESILMDAGQCDQ